jgi:GNAT superfamily N-acetyltransferase
LPLLDLSNGYYELPKGKLANVVTCLEMLAKPASTSGALPEGLRLERFGKGDLAEFRALFRTIGEDLMWFSRLIMPDQELASILGDVDVESYALMRGSESLGLLELDFRDRPNCELSFFGLRKDAIGGGLGRTLMNAGIHKAWERPITRFWVHTCHYDHPNALGFYQRSGFTPYALMVEVHDDPRLQGKLPETASPHVALLRP